MITPSPRLSGSLRRHRPRQFQLTDYKRWFPTTANMFLRYLKRYDILRTLAPADGPAAAVIVGPWVSTQVPWYAIMVAIGLRRRGRNVVLLWDDTGFPEKFVAEQNRAIGRVLAYVGNYLPVMRLSQQQPGSLADSDDALVESLTLQNVTWIRRGAIPSEKDQRLATRIGTSLRESLPLVRGWLDHFEYDYIVVPGGVYGTSGLYVHVARTLGCRVATFDTDRRIGQICVDGVAAQNADIPRAFQALWQGDDAGRSAAIDIARLEFQSRTDNRDSYGFQAQAAVGSDPTSDGSVLIPMNVEWDTAALGRHRHFANSADWITATVAEILEADEGPVIVRQHPSERRELQRSNLDIGGILVQRFGDDPRCRFVAADAPVSSYDLLRSARLVLPFVSTIAMEAAAIGKPVLISGAAYYADLGFVRSASSREEYFSLLRHGLRGELASLPAQSERAWACYYLAAVQNRIPTDFTPHPEDFWDWCGRSPESMFEDREVSAILESIDTDVPISLLRHRRNAGHEMALRDGKPS